MSQKLNATFTIISLSVVFWTCAVVLADLTAANHAPSPQQHAAPAVPLQLKPLEEKVNANPESLDARLELAYKLVEFGAQNSQNGQLMAGISQYGAVLQKDPKNREALRALAALSLENGITDKALDYYTRLLELEPNDPKTRNDYALALIQIGRAEESITLLRSILEENAEAFPVQLTLAVAYKVAGKNAEARVEAEKARELAPDQEAVRVVDDFIANIDKKGGAAAADPETAQGRAEAQARAGTPGSETASPATTITSYFKSHPILGPKISALSWPDAQTVHFELKDFPINEMPPFAQARLTENAQKALAGLKQEFSVQFIDAGTKELLLDLKIGGRPAAALTSGG